jgi:predicted amidohydrolase
LYTASTLAKENHLIVIINLCTLQAQHENKIHVTDVVFDENGKYITHYHKSHIFFKCIFSKPDEIKTVTFHSFGLEFGLIICFDLFWKNPKVNLLKKGIKHYPYCYAMRCAGRIVARFWSWCHKIVLIGANLGKYAGIFQKGKEVKHDIKNDVYLGIIEKI